MRRAAIIVLMLLGCCSAVAQQQGGTRPAWVDGYFRELGNSYIEVVSATATDHGLARNKAARLLVERRNMASGGRYTVTISNGQVQVNGSDELTVKARIIDEYVEHRGEGDWVVYLLAQTAKNPMLDYDAVSVSDRYPISYRTFVPGMTQIYKGQTAKAAIMIGAEVAMVAGIVGFESGRSSYVNKIASTHSARQRTQYTDNANKCADMRNVCIAGAAAVWAWSIVDAIVGQGPRQVFVGDASMMLAPYASPTGFGLAMNINL